MLYRVTWNMFLPVCTVYWQFVELFILQVQISKLLSVKPDQSLLRWHKRNWRNKAVSGIKDEAEQESTERSIYPQKIKYKLWLPLKG